MKDCAKCILLKKKIETLQEEIAEYKRASSCPNCKKLRGMLEQVQEAVAEKKREAKPHE